jgi:hypothetical protein
VGAPDGQTVSRSRHEGTRAHLLAVSGHHLEKLGYSKARQDVSSIFTCFLLCLDHSP